MWLKKKIVLISVGEGSGPCKVVKCDHNILWRTDAKSAAVHPIPYVGIDKIRYNTSIKDEKETKLIYLLFACLHNPRPLSWLLRWIRFVTPRWMTSDFEKDLSKMMESWFTKYDGNGILYPVSQFVCTGSFLRLNKTKIAIRKYWWQKLVARCSYALVQGQFAPLQSSGGMKKTMEESIF